MRHEAFTQTALPCVSLPELVGAFSYALDLTEGQPAGHCLRSAWIGAHLAKATGIKFSIDQLTRHLHNEKFSFQPAKHTVLQLYTVITAKVPAGNSGGEVGLRQLLSSFIPGILLHVANWHDDYFDTTCV